MRDCFCVCCDGLKGLPEAIAAIWPLADVQLCVVHLVSSLRYTCKKHWGQVCRELREIYTAPSLEAAQARFAEFTDTWGERYPAMIAVWERAGDDFVPRRIVWPARRRALYGRVSPTCLLVAGAVDAAISPLLSAAPA